MLYPALPPGVVSPSPGGGLLPYPTPAVKGLLELDDALNIDLIPGRPGNRGVVAHNLRPGTVSHNTLVKLRSISRDLSYSRIVRCAVIENVHRSDLVHAARILCVAGGQ